MVVFASEDVGNADPRALEVAVNAAHAVEHVGMPECALNLSQAAIYLALAPKSNAAIKSLGRARAWVRDHGTPEPPPALRSAAYPAAKKLGRGKGYEYPHDKPGGLSEQELMPDSALGERFLELSEHGLERELRERWDAIREARGRD
jgi:putative ATPase